MSEDLIIWADPADEDAFRLDLMLYGNAYRRQLPDSSWAHIPMAEIQERKPEWAQHMSNWWDGLPAHHPWFPYRGIEPIAGTLTPPDMRKESCPKCGAGHLRNRADNTRQCRDCDTIC